MICGHVEIRMLNLKTIGRSFADDLIINAGSGICAECDPSKAERANIRRGSIKSMA
jgi:hypothetical protein